MGNYSSQVRHIRLVLSILRLIIRGKPFTIKALEGFGFSRKTIQKYLYAFRELGFVRLKDKTWYPKPSEAVSFLYNFGRERIGMRTIISMMARRWVNQGENDYEKDRRLVALLIDLLLFTIDRSPFWYVNVK